MICVLLIIFAALALCREFGVFDLKQANAKLTPEERKFQACVNQAMRSERVSERKEIKKLICYPTPDIGSMDEFESLEEVLIRNDDFDSMHEIPCLPNLKKLSIGGEKIKSIDGLDQFSNLTELAILSNMLSSIKEIPATLNLETLKIRSNPRLINLDGVEQFKSLKWFEVKRNSITDITAIASLTELEAIDLTALSNLNKLETARFRALKTHDFSPLHGKPNMRHPGATGKDIPCEAMSKWINTLEPQRRKFMWVSKHCRFLTDNL